MFTKAQAVPPPQTAQTPLAPTHTVAQPGPLPSGVPLNPVALTRANVLQLHRTLGNQAVGRMLTLGQLQRQVKPGTLQREMSDAEIKEKVEEEGGYIQMKAKPLGRPQPHVIQRAYTARRPLGGYLSFGLESRWVENKGVFHEHIFFEDGKQPPNWGFMGKGGVAEEKDAELLGKYVKIEKNLDDEKMRQAVDAIGDPGAYELFGNNCQRYVARVLVRYKQLVKAEDDILDEVVEDLLVDEVVASISHDEIDTEAVLQEMP